MPRYNITLTAGNGECQPSSRRIWADDDQAAMDYAKSWLALRRNVTRAGRPYDTWEVWIGDPPYVRHKTVATGEIQARR